MELGWGLRHKLKRALEDIKSRGNENINDDRGMSGEITSNHDEEYQLPNVIEEPNQFTGP